MTPFGPLRADAQILDGLRAFAIFRRQPHDDRKMPVAAGLVQIARAVAADGDTNRGVDIARRQAITRSARAIDIDLDGGLAQ